MDGVLVVDKPGGMTSHDVVALARRSLRERRIGHTGTLDPMATGVLPLACGRATRLVRFLMASDKDYEAVIRFGLTTDTGDVTGTEIARSSLRPHRAAVDDAVAALRGEHLQTPPAYSAKKIGGRRAYALARREEAVTLRPVPVRVAASTVTAFDGETATVRLTCSAGFYVRAFAEEVGRRTATRACLASLRRTRSGAFGLSDAVTVHDLREAATHAAGRMIALERLLTHLPAIALTPEGRRRIAHGQLVDETHQGTTTAGAPAPSDAGGLEPAEGESGGWTRLMDAEGRLVALAMPAAGGALHPAIVLI